MNTYMDRATILSLVGEAITQWAKVEGELLELFAWCNAPSKVDVKRGTNTVYNYGYSANIFRELSFESKVKVLKAAMRSTLSRDEPSEESLHAQWTTFRKHKIPPAYKLRNKCAHWVADIYNGNAYLLPSSDYMEKIESIGHSNPEKRAETVEGVREFGENFQGLSISLSDLRKALLDLPGPKHRWLLLAQDYLS